jgi:hypothetical protein
MNIYAKLAGLVFIPTAILVSCSSCAERINQQRQKNAEIIANDLRQMKMKSKYYRESEVWIEVDQNVRVKTKGGWEVAFYIWPRGPFKVLDIETNNWRFEE